MPTRNAQNDRKLQFIPNRILKAEELVRVQQLDQARDVRGLGTIFQEGATLNVKTEVSGATISLSPESADYPMWVFVNGSWEQIAPASFNLDPSKQTGDDYIYLNWAIWRVTADGESGSIADESLLDVGSGEKVAEAGQLELIVSTNDTSATTLDGDKQFAKNTSPVVMFRLERGENGSITPHQTIRVIDAAKATKALAGFVTLSTNTANGVAVSNDDPRLVQELKPNSVYDFHVSKPEKYIPIEPTQFFGTPKAKVLGDGIKGISTTSVYDAATSTVLSDLIPAMATMLLNVVANVQALANNAGSQTPAPAYQQPPAYVPPPAPAIPDGHVGQPLGESGTHPARVESDTEGFAVVRKSAGAGSSANVGYGIKDRDNNLLVGMTHDGDVVASKAKVSTIGSTQLATLSVIAATLANHVNNHPGAGGGGGTSQEYVDNQDTAGLTEAKAYTDQKIAAVGVPAIDIADSENDNTNIRWKILTIGTLQIAFGHGSLQNGATVRLPQGFWGWDGTAQFGRTFSLRSADQLHCYMEGQNVVCFTQDQDGNRSNGDWANVSGMCFRWL
jgi:hypothetical protein